jgi:hypothetical protein
MTAEKHRAAPEAADFARAAGLERQGSAMYARLSFPEATASFRAAGDLFAKALPPPTPPVATAMPAAPRAPASARTAPTPSGPAPVATTPAAPTPVAPSQVTPVAPLVTSAPSPADPRAQIRALLDNYVRAAETKDVELLRRVRPGLSDNDLRIVRAQNEIKRSHKVDLRIYEITISGEEAQAQGRREDVIVLSSGQRIQTETRVAFMLKHNPRGWVISEIRESADRPPAQTRTPARVPQRPDTGSR